MFVGPEGGLWSDRMVLGWEESEKHIAPAPTPEKT